jgi:hypothetical protein
MRDEYKIFVGKYYWNSVLGIVRHRREDNVEAEPREIDCYSENCFVISKDSVH